MVGSLQQLLDLPFGCGDDAGGDAERVGWDGRMPAASATGRVQVDCDLPEGRFGP